MEQTNADLQQKHILQDFSYLFIMFFWIYKKNQIIDYKHARWKLNNKNQMNRNVWWKRF